MPMPQLPKEAAMLKFLGIEEKSCDPLTGAFCSEEQQLGRLSAPFDAGQMAMMNRFIWTLQV